MLLATDVTCDSMSNQASKPTPNFKPFRNRAALTLGQTIILTLAYSYSLTPSHYPHHHFVKVLKHKEILSPSHISFLFTNALPCFSRGQTISRKAFLSAFILSQKRKQQQTCKRPCDYDFSSKDFQTWILAENVWSSNLTVG